MENQSTCYLCKRKPKKTYYCECGHFFCKYHHHLLLHKCTYQFHIPNRLSRIINHNNCYVCTKPSLPSYRCYCDGFFCLKHRYYEKHHCTFDLRSIEIERLKQQLPLIISGKVPNRI